MSSNMNRIPKCIQLRLTKSGLLFLSVAIISIIATILSRNPIDLLLGAVICTVGGIYVWKVYVSVKEEKMYVFEGICVGTRSGNEIGNLTRNILAGCRGYTLQGDGKTIELNFQGSLHLYKGQKYRFYFPVESFNSAEEKSVIKEYQFYGYEMIY